MTPFAAPLRPRSYWAPQWLPPALVHAPDGLPLPEFRDGEVVGIRSIAQPRPYPGEPEEVRKAHEYQFKFLSPKRRAKIAHAFLSRHSLATSSDC